MRGNFARCLAWVLVHEGGYVNHPKDPGGATNRGVIQRTYDAYRRRMGLAKRSVRQITQEEVEVIYRDQYWDAVRGDDLPAGVDYATFDYAVNSGAKRAIKDLQRVVGAKADGWIGQETMAAIQSKPPQTIVVELCERRYRFVRSLRHWKTFGRGWSRRIMGEKMGVQNRDIGVIDRASLLATSADLLPNTAANSPEPKSEAPGKALDEDAGAIAVATAAAKDPKWLGLVGTFGTTLATVATNSGPIAWAVAGVMIIGGVYLIYRLERDRATS